ncbi:MAG: APC family permease [Bacillota bacterium]|nr:APC family permease [Bacillota bacterium]
MFKRLKSIFIGRPLPNEALAGEKYSVFWGLPILASDAVSSVAYAGQEMLLVLIPAIGVLAFGQLTLLSGVIIGLLVLLTISYRQTIDSYPSGGGSFIVAKDNLGVISGITAGAALSVDYILTVAVSVSSGVEQMATAFQFLKPYTVVISVVLVILLMIGNLRGIRESSRIFSIPTYAFIFCILAMIITGFVRIANGYVPTVPEITSAAEPLTLLLMLRAFSNGCTALTGIEAVSNAVPNFRDPAQKRAKTVLTLLAIIVLVLFGGTAVLAQFYHVVPVNNAMLVLIAGQIFGNTFMYYAVTVTTFVILVMAANTAYSGFPVLLSVMAKEGYAPRQLSMRGDRLSFGNGILLLSSIAIVLIIAFSAKVSALIGLYAIGVFTSFTLSQTGMLIKWIRHKGKRWLPKAIVNGLGAVVTAIVVVIIAITKFNEGAYIVVIIVPILIFLMLRVKRHYAAVQKQLRMTSEEISAVDLEKAVYRNRVIVPIENINKASIRALRYAKTISDNITAFTVATDEESAARIREKYALLDTDIPLIVKYSTYRKVVEPLLKFIESTEFDYRKGDMITVMLPQFVVRKWWQRLLHNNTRYFIERQLLKHKHIVVAVMPLQLKDDKTVLKNDQKAPK